MKKIILSSLLLVLLSISAFSQNKKEAEVIAVAKQAVTAQENLPKYSNFGKNLCFRLHRNFAAWRD